MNDLEKRILEIMCNRQLAGLATITEDGKPWVRYMMITGEEDFTVRCATFVHARKVSQIKKNPEVHLTCGVTNLTDFKPYLQIQGRAVLSTTQEEKVTFWHEELTNVFTGPDDPNYGVIIVKPYRIEYCAPGKFEPEVWTRK